MTTKRYLNPGLFVRNRHSLLLDAGALAAAVALEIQFGPAYPADFVQLHRLDIGREQREGPFHTHAIGDLPNREGGGMSLTLPLDHFTFETLDTLLVSFDDLIIDGDVVTRLEGRNLSFARQLFVYEGYS